MRLDRSPALLACASGVLYSLAYPPASLYLLSWVALIPFFLALTRVSPGRGAACGLVWTLTATVGLGLWFPGMLERYFGLSVWESWLALGMLGLLVHALPYAVFGAWLAWSARRGAVSPLLVGAAWSLAELVRANSWIGDPFALLGYTQYATPLAQTSDVAGPYGVSLLVAAGNAALAALLVPKLRGDRPVRSFAAIAAVLAAASLYGVARLAEDFGEGKWIRVAVIQGAVTRERDWSPKQRAVNLERYLELTREAAGRGPDLVFWPEFAVDFYLRESTSDRERLLAEARGSGADLLLGGAHYRHATTGPHYYNSVFLVREGALADRYDKIRLVPFSEYAPLGDWLRAETALYESGERVRLLRARPARVGAFVCGEVLYPDLVRSVVRAGAEVLANPSNDYWFGSPAPSLHQFQIARFRAIESRRYLVRATPTGYSAVIDPHGRPLVRSGYGGAEVLDATVRVSSTTTPYQHWGDKPAWAALLWVVGSAARRRDRIPRNFGGES
jgi:apolipoprotein N-acyltransferase